MKQKDIYDKNNFVSIDEILKDSGKDDKSKSLEKIVSEAQPRQCNAADSILNDILTDKAKFLRQILEEIKEQMEGRNGLKEVIMDKIDNRLCMLKSKIYEIDTWGVGNNRNIDSRRS